MSAPQTSRHSGRFSLLTGATGFVGRFLLSHLLQEQETTIYCLIRAPSKIEAYNRIRGVLSKWDLWHPRYERRIVAVPGDLRLGRLGLGDSDYRTLAQVIDSIYHCGASVNHLESYDRAKAANVIATEELLRIASEHTIKPIHYISTLGVFTDPHCTGTRVVCEDTPIECERHRQSTGYITSKWVAECIIIKARNLGHPCNIYRLGLLWADSRSGRFDDLQHVYRLLKSALLSGSAVESYRFKQDPVPVDYAARAIVALSKKYQGERGVFHITSSRQAPDGLFERCNRLLQEPLALMPLYDWIQRLKQLHEAGRSLPIVPLLDFAFSMSRQQISEHVRLSQLSHVHASCQRTSEELAQLGIASPPVYHDLLTECLDGMLMRDADLAALLPIKQTIRRVG